MTRTFIALELDESLHRYLGETTRRMAQELPGLRWVAPEGIHLTLAFLGELNDEQLAEALRATERAAREVSPFEYRLARPGLFGSPKQPRVIWIGIDEPSGNLQLLHRQLSLELVQHGFEVDTRPYSPHLTLARIKGPLKQEEQQRLQQLLSDRDPRPYSPTYRVSHLSVIKSELMRTGSRYSSLLDVALGPKE
jgi:RNA 2',3'-cyclic 3'-phosphodiesterase